MKKTLALSILVSILVIVSIAMVSADSGRVWTTRSDCITPQNENHYYPGEHVWIKGSGFDAGDYDWTITGQPGQASCDPEAVVESGSITVDQSGSCCFDAHTVQSGECGEYKAQLDNKHDNYNVIPEFGLFVGGLTILAAVGIFFFVRKK